MIRETIVIFNHKKQIYIFESSNYEKTEELL